MRIRYRTARRVEGYADRHRTRTGSDGSRPRPAVDALLRASRRGAEVPVADAVEDGHVTVWLDGEKLRGGYALTRTGHAGEKERWILVKKSDGEADARRNPVSSQPASVRTGRTIEDLAEQDADGG